jgi:hypothetical protein
VDRWRVVAFAHDGDVPDVPVTALTGPQNWFIQVTGIASAAC